MLPSVIFEEAVYRDSFVTFLKNFVKLQEINCVGPASLPKKRFWEKSFPVTFRNFLKTGILNPLSANPTKWSNTLKQFVVNFPTSRLSVFDHFVGLAIKGWKVLGGCFYYLFLSLTFSLILFFCEMNLLVIYLCQIKN